MDLARGLPWTSRLFALATAVAVLAYATLLIEQARTRKPWNDEAMSASAGYTLATKGYMAIPSFDEANPGMSGIHRHMYYIFPFQMAVMALWYKVAGFSLLTTRVLSMLWAALLFVALYQLLKLFSGNAWVALLGVVLTATDYQVISAAAFGRYDMMVAALGISGYASFLLLRERHFELALLIGNACIAAAGMTHPNGVIYFLGLWFLIVYYDRGRVGFKQIAFAFLPYLAGAAVWAWYIFQDFPDFKEQLTGNSSNRVGLLHPWQTLKNELTYRYLRAYGLGPHSPGYNSDWIRLKAVALLGYLTGIAGCLAVPSIRKHAGYRVLIFLTAIHFLFFAFYEGMKFNYYLVHLVPFYLALLAVFAFYCWRMRPSFRSLVAALILALAAVGVGGILMKIHLNDMGVSYAPAVAFVKQNASPHDLIFASCSFVFGYGLRPNLVDDDTFGYFSKREPRFIVVEEIYEDMFNFHRAWRPEVYAHIMELMPEYRLVYDKNGYKVYERISQPGLAAAAATRH